MSSTFQILHISDLHIKAEEGFDRSVVLDPLIGRIRKDLESGFSPELVVTGDIACHGIKAQYDYAKPFFDDLLAALNLAPERLFLVPGNHDVNRRKYRPTDVPSYENMKQLNDELEDEDYRRDLFKGMEEYFEFVEKHYRHLTSANPRLVPFVVPFDSACSRRIFLVGLNSAWMCRKSPDHGTIAIGEYQVKKAMEGIKGKSDSDLVVAVFHHPLEWLWPDDKKKCRNYLRGMMMLCGHLHEAEGGYFRDYEGDCFQFQAGCAYAGSSYMNRFQYITIDFEQGKIRLDFRAYDSEKSKWHVDAATGDEGKAEFDMPGTERAAEPEKRDIFDESPFKKYLDAALHEHRHLPMQGFVTNLRVPIELQRVYVNMRANVHWQEFEYTLEGKRRIQERARSEKLDALDIRGAFQAMARHRLKDMVILGDPGSGKTTLLKYVLIRLIEGSGPEMLGIMAPLFPFFAPLRELRDPARETFPAFIMRVCRLAEYGISSDLLKNTLEAGRAIILLDGLDEVADARLRIEACRFIDRARADLPKTRFVITSRFAGYLGESRLSGAVLELAVQDFTPEEVREFLTKWFETVEVFLHPATDEERSREKGHAEALALVKTIEGSEHLRRLAVNPLLLQIIALVHRDRGRLPERRVDLYEECTNILLERWDVAKGLNVLLTAKEAREVLQPLAFWLHGKDQRRSAPLAEIREVVNAPLEDMGKSGIDPGALLLNIRDRSGIFMGYGGEEFGFTHLSFQEYLTAEQIRNKSLVEFLVSKYTDRWWREVTLLCLALNNPSVIEEFMEKLIALDVFQGEISLVTSAVNDSIPKPSRPFLEAVGNETLPAAARYNALRVLQVIGGDKVVDLLRKLVDDTDRKLGLMAFEALTALGRADGIAQPATGEPPVIFVSPIDGAEMVLVPAGTFLYGSREDDKLTSSDKKPQRVIDLPSFHIDKYPVTNSQYCMFLNDRRPSKKQLEKWIFLSGSGQRIVPIQERQAKRGDVYRVKEGYEKHPVAYVTWHGAAAYAEWAGKRLPTEQEWEKAARGTDGRIYPWGNEFDAGRCNTSESRIGTTTPVDRYKTGESPFGCYDMAGNVWEWTDSWYDEGMSLKVIRGGSWTSSRTSHGAPTASGSTLTSGTTSTVSVAPGQRSDSPLSFYPDRRRRSKKFFWRKKGEIPIRTSFGRQHKLTCHACLTWVSVATATNHPEPLDRAASDVFR